jgi:hypothetical protein
LHSIEDLHSRRNDFGVQVREQGLDVPEDLARALAKHGIRDAFNLMQFLYTFPSALARDLGWRLVEVEAARGKLVRQLDVDGRLPSALLRPRVREERGSGARRPEGAR